MSNDDNGNKDDKFTSAMDDLKGLLDKEGIKLNGETNTAEDIIPTLNTIKIDIPDVQNPSAEDTNELATDNDFSDNDSTTGDLPVLDGTITVVDENADDTDSIDLDDYISDIEDDNFELTDFADSFAELEEKVEAITDPEHLHNFELGEEGESHQPVESPQPVDSHQQEESHQSKHSPQQSISSEQLENLKNALQQQLSQQIDTAVNELKTQLTDSMHREINQLFDNLSSK